MSYAEAFINNRPAAAKIDAGPCVSHPDEVGTIRHGTAVPKVAGEYSVPEGRAKSALAPIRRPPSRGGPLHRSAPTLFSLDRARPVSLLARQKRNGGCIPAEQAPLREQIPSRPPSGGPSPPSSRHICPAIPMTVFPWRQTAAPFHRKGRITPHAGHHPTTGI